MAATDERAIHEFPTGTIDDNSLLIMDRPTLTPGEYETEKFAIANLGLKLLGGIDFPNNLDTDEQDIFGAINEVNAKAMNIAAEYDETASYSKGDYCIYQNAAYRCIKDPGTTTGTFVAADWTQIKVLSEVKANTEEIGLKQNATDNTLSTTDKTVVGAINELNTGVNDLDSLVDKLSGFSIIQKDISGNSSYTTPTYSLCCLVFLSRGGSGLYMGHWSGVSEIVSAAGHTATFNNMKVTIANNTGTTDRIIVIYR